MSRLPLCLLALVAAGAAGADPARIVAATSAPDGAGRQVSVTLRHGDIGWEDYADAGRVELEDGTVLATRELVHPHVTEQPFTRSLGGVAVPADVDRVHIRARTLTGGWGDDRLALPLD
ncbi:hypothetical protein [Palleronia rufa]|uniref:hypothetical protein n=1 Tax=Palleronia rufa TaxID=1530186 RepID=UPI000561864B|nr:hypothetical protein [Palleronia rufa]